MNFFEMLVMSQKLSFVDGRVTLYGQNILIFPAPSMVDYMGNIDASPESIKEVYKMLKDSMIENKQNLSKAYKTSESLEWISSTVNLYGLGKVHFEGAPKGVPIGEIRAENSPFCESLRGKVDVATCHVLRGIVAGIVSAIFDQEVDVIELECNVNTNDRCKLILDYRKTLETKYPEICAAQI